MSLQSCTKISPEKENNFKHIDNSIVHLKDSVISFSSSQFIVRSEVVFLAESKLNNDLLQGWEEGASVSFSAPTYADIEVTSISNIEFVSQKEPTAQSTLILVDKSDGNPYEYRWDDCMTFWIDHISGENEYALGTFSSFYEDGYKIFGGGFFNELSSGKTETLYNLYGETADGEHNPFEAAYHGLDYLISEGSYAKKNLVILSYFESEEGDTWENLLIDKALANNISIHIIAGSDDYDYNRVAGETNGFYMTSSGYSEIRMNILSLAKVLENRYTSLVFDLTVESLSGPFTVGGYYGFYISINGETIYIHADY